MEDWRKDLGQNCGRPGMVSKGNFFVCVCMCVCEYVTGNILL